MLANKLKLVTDKMAPLMPSTDAGAFKDLMYSYVQQLQSGVKTLPAPNTSNSRVNSLASVILNSLASEKMNPAMDKAKKWYGGYNYYWNNPWWWNYWYYSWSPNYWWRWDPYPYDGITYIGGSKKVGHANNSGIMDNVLDSMIDVHSMNLVCDDNRQCDFNVQFTKAPLMYNTDLLTVDENGNELFQ